MEKTIKLDYNYMMSDYLKRGQGISKSDLDAYQAVAENAFNAVQEGRGKGMMGWTELAYNQDDIVEDILTTAEYIRENFDYFVVLGIGGSALGPIAVFQALCHLRHNDLPKDKRKAPKFYVEDNIDPDRMQSLLEVIDIKKTMFNVITKSGSTSETMSQYLIINDILEKQLGKEKSKHIIATTDEKKGNLIKIAKRENYKTFYIPDGVGGRFSEICPVGLLPAAVLNIDIKEMLRGVKHMDKQCVSSDIRENMALNTALLQYISINKGKNISVMMPYADSLKSIADWYCQLWAESIGKRYDLDGKEVYSGQTPVKALGVTDQHSQVQLYTEGPYDKVITIIALDNYKCEVGIPNGCEDIPEVNFLCGHTLNELINNERLATEYALMKADRANHTITLPEVNAFYIGQLMMLFMLETSYIGAMLNINTFDQPGVEEGKNATYALFGREGYEKKRAELMSANPKSDKYIL